MLRRYSPKHVPKSQASAEFACNLLLVGSHVLHTIMIIHSNHLLNVSSGIFFPRPNTLKMTGHESNTFQHVFDSFVEISHFCTDSIEKDRSNLQ